MFQKTIVAKMFRKIFRNAEQDFFEDVIKMSGKERVNIFFDPEYYKMVRDIPSDMSMLDIVSGINKGDIVQNDHSRSVSGASQVMPYYVISSESNTNKPYMFHFINIDLQKDQTFRAGIVDKSGEATDIPASNIANPGHGISFEFGSGT